MGNARLDVLRLFQHYGLDPADYLDTSAVRSTVVAPALSSRRERLSRLWTERDLYDYRNFDLGPDCDQ